LIWFKKQTQAGILMWNTPAGVVKQHEPASQARDGLQEGVFALVCRRILRL